MPGLDFIKRYQEGRQVTETPSEEKSEERPIPVSKAAPSKGPYALPTPTGKTAVDESILERMQQLINEREARKGGFMEAMRDAQAWWSGGMAGPSEALARRAKEKEDFEATTFGMRRDLAQQRIAQERARARMGEIAPPQTGGAPTGEGAAAPAAGGGGATIFGAGPAQTQYLIDVVKDPATRAVVMDQLKDQDPDAAAATIRAYVAKNSGDTDLMKDLRYGLDKGLITPQAATDIFRLRVSGGAETFKPFAVNTAEGKVQSSPLAASRTAFGGAAPAMPTGAAPAMPAGAAPAMPAPRAPAMPAGATPAMPAPRAPAPTAGGMPTPVTPAVTRPAAPAAPAAAPVAPTPAAGSVGGFAPASEEALEIRKEALGTELKERAKDINLDRNATVEAGSNAGERLASVQYLNNLITTNPRAFGVLQRPGVLTAVLGAAEEGANLGNLGSAGISGMSNAVRKAMPGATQSEIDAAQKATREFALMQLSAAKIYLKGQGAVSDAERVLIREMAGSIKNSPGALRDMLKWNEIRADFDKKNGAAYKEFDKRNPNVSFSEYKKTPEYERLKAEYENNLKQFVQYSTAPKPDVKSHPALKLIPQYLNPSQPR